MRLSKEKRDKIAEQILSLLYDIFPDSMFTASIAHSIIRDEEFTKALLYELYNRKLIINIRKNPKGIAYSRRMKWRLSGNAYDAYKKASQI